MTDSSHRTLERIARRVPVPEPAYDRLLRRRDRKERSRRVSAAVLAIVLTLLSITGLMRAFRDSERPATEPTPTPADTGIFSGMGGWIAYGDRDGIWAVDPSRPGDLRIQLSRRLWCAQLVGPIQSPGRATAPSCSSCEHEWSGTRTVWHRIFSC